MHILPQQQSIAWVWFPPSAYGRICAASSTWRTCELVNAHCRLYRSVTITRNAPCPSRGKTVYGRPNRGPATTCSDSTAFRASLQPQIDFRPNSTTSYFVVRKPLPLNCWHRPVRDRNPFLPFEEKKYLQEDAADVVVCGWIGLDTPSLPVLLDSSPHFDFSLRPVLFPKSSPRKTRWEHRVVAKEAASNDEMGVG